MSNKLKIFSGRSNPDLALKIANSAKCELGKISIKTFSDGELWVKYEENIRGCDVFLIQSTNGPAENILEIALMADAAVRASADRVSVIIPYFGYGRQDRKDQPRVPISSRVMIDIFEAMGTNRIITMDLHSTQIQGFSKVPFDGDGTSILTLSVSSSTKGSSATTFSPLFLSHLDTVASDTDSPKAGTNIFSDINQTSLPPFLIFLFVAQDVYLNFQSQLTQMVFFQHT